MSTFDIQSMLPDGYEIISAENLGSPYPVSIKDEEMIYQVSITIRKKWTPKVGEVIAVRDSEDMDWDFDAFERLRDDGNHPIGCARDYWAECRQLTPEERGE